MNYKVITLELDNPASSKLSHPSIDEEIIYNVNSPKEAIHKSYFYRNRFRYQYRTEEININRD